MVQHAFVPRYLRASGSFGPDDESTTWCIVSRVYCPLSFHIVSLRKVYQISTRTQPTY